MKGKVQSAKCKVGGVDEASENGLPKGWTSQRIREVVALNPGIEKGLLADHEPATFVPMPAVGAGTGKVDISILRPYAEIKKGYTPFNTNDVIFAKITPCMENGKIAVVPKIDTKVALGSTEFHVLRVTPELLPTFLYYFISRLSFRKEAESQMSGAVGQRRVPKSFIENYHIPLPPPPVQQKIVAKIEELFSDLDAGVESLKKAQVQLKVYRQSVLKAAFEGKLTAEWRAKQKKLPTAQELLATIQAKRQTHYEAKLKEWKTATTKWEKSGKLGKKPSKPSEPEEMLPLSKDELKELPKLPEGWAWCKLGQAYQVNVGATPSRKDTAYWNGNIPWVSSGEVAFRPIHSTHESITEDGLSNASTQIQPIGSVMLAMIGEGKTRGQAAILKIGACHNQNTASINVFSQSSEYLYYYLFSQYEQTRRIGSGNNQKALNKSRIQNMAFPICSPVEQKHIGEYLELKDSEISNQSEIISFAISQAGTLRQSILKRAFEGKLV